MASISLLSILFLPMSRLQTCLLRLSLFVYCHHLFLQLCIPGNVLLFPPIHNILRLRSQDRQKLLAECNQTIFLNYLCKSHFAHGVIHIYLILYYKRQNIYRFFQKQTLLFLYLQEYNHF